MNAYEQDDQGECIRARGMGQDDHGECIRAG